MSNEGVQITFLWEASYSGAGEEQFRNALTQTSWKRLRQCDVRAQLVWRKNGKNGDKYHLSPLVADGYACFQVCKSLFLILRMGIWPMIGPINGRCQASNGRCQW